MLSCLVRPEEVRVTYTALPRAAGGHVDTVACGGGRQCDYQWRSMDSCSAWRASSRAVLRSDEAAGFRAEVELLFIVIWPS